MAYKLAIACIANVASLIITECLILVLGWTRLSLVNLYQLAWILNWYASILTSEKLMYSLLLSAIDLKNLADTCFCCCYYCNHHGSKVYDTFDKNTSIGPSSNSRTDIYWILSCWQQVLTISRQIFSMGVRGRKDAGCLKMNA